MEGGRKNLPSAITQVTGNYVKGKRKIARTKREGGDYPCGPASAVSPVVRRRQGKHAQTRGKEPKGRRIDRKGKSS